jgi:fatty-acid desaturase
MHAYLKLFILAVFHLILGYGLLTSDQWPLIIVCGIILFYPLHHIGSSIGYHRLFSHNAFTPRPWYPYLATFLSSISFFGDPLLYAMVHRIHHRHSDQKGDPHNPQDGIFHAYIGWMVKFKPTYRDHLVIADLVRKYPWMVPFGKYEPAVPIVFYLCLFAINPTVGYIVLLASLLAVNSGFYVNAFAHTTKNDTGHQHNAFDNVFLAKWVNPIFLHKQHHDRGNLIDYSNDQVKDIWAPLIRKFFMKIDEPKI